MDNAKIIEGLEALKAAAEANLENYRAGDDERAIKAGESMVKAFEEQIAMYR